jgi:hypothetical protein
LKIQKRKNSLSRDPSGDNFEGGSKRKYSDNTPEKNYQISENSSPFVNANDINMEFDNNKS